MDAQDPTGRFGAQAAAYRRHRPGYPDAVLDLLLEGLGPPEGLAAADLGAGTGLSSRLLASRMGRVLAVEPDARMRAQAEAGANVVWVDGTAERTGLPDGAVDLAAFFQAFHWFDPDRAVAEFRRIARRRIALVQYERDETQPFARAYGALIRPHVLDDTEARRLRALEAFSEKAGPDVRRTVLAFGQTLDLEGLLGLLASSSYLPQDGEAARRLREEARDIFRVFERNGRIELARSLFVLVKDLG